MQPLQHVDRPQPQNAWCPSCTCGWHKPIDAFDVTPPEPSCRNTVCQCHQGFWDTDPVLYEGAGALVELDELTVRRLWGDR